MEVVVEDKQLSLAIGKKGQNVRLAAKLTGWRIDIKSEEEKRREVEAAVRCAGRRGAEAGEPAGEIAASRQVNPPARPRPRRVNPPARSTASEPEPAAIAEASSEGSDDIEAES